MTNLVDIPSVVRTLVDYFSAYDEATRLQVIRGVTLKGRDNLSGLKDDLLTRPEVQNTVKRFRMNPFDMENVFDLEDVLKKALEQHSVFTGQPGDSVNNRPGKADDQGLLPLMRYMQWANGIFYESCSELPAGILTKNRPMLFDSILNLLHHIYMMGLVWQAHLEGGEHGFTTRRPTEEISFTELRRKQSELDDWYVAYSGELAAEQCHEIVNFEFIGGGAGAMSRFDILQHVVNHTSYHRGHIEGVFYQIGIEPPTTDLPVFLAT